MKNETELILGIAREALSRHCTVETVRRAGLEGWVPELWAALEEVGLPLVGVPESSGGTGGGAALAGEVLRLAGRFAAPVPLAETSLMAGWLLAESGFAVPNGPLTVAPCSWTPSFDLRRGARSWHLTGHARQVPWGRCASRIVVLAHGDGKSFLVPVAPAACSITPGENMAGEPRDDVRLVDLEVAGADMAEAPAGVDEASVMARGALGRAAAMAGALDRVLEMATTHAGQRVQFGRPLSRFQAIQHYLAAMAGEVAAANAAVEGAIERAEAADAAVEVAMAKIRAGEAAGVVARLAHQIHGAIGFTHEHPLHLFTRRLWAWREEFGSEVEWSVRLGRAILAGGPERAWEVITSPPGGAGASTSG